VGKIDAKIQIGMMRVVITGPESTGKTYLAEVLSRELGAPWVPEYAREFLWQLHRSYVEADLLEIAKGQVKSEEAAAHSSPEILILDTDLLVIKIWSEFKFGRCHPWIEQQLEQRKGDLYLLCLPDIPWEPDPQREHPYQREELLTIYRQELSKLGVGVVEISGDFSSRTQSAKAAIQKCFLP
jgi:NadR type nicotinamide-nucleotide adenylyltransferase